MIGSSFPVGIVDSPQFDYIQKGNPTIDVNPKTQYATWLNVTSGELWICTDNTKGFNWWKGNNGHAIGYYSLPHGEILTSFASPLTYPYGLAFDGTNLISCDLASDMIYVHDGVTSNILTSFASPSTYPTGLTFDGVNLISCDTGSHRIYVHKRADEIGV
jgi:sugar lactone lactonase YvrE